MKITSKVLKDNSDAAKFGLPNVFKNRKDGSVHLFLSNNRAVCLVKTDDLRDAVGGERRNLVSYLSDTAWELFTGKIELNIQ